MKLYRFKKYKNTVYVVTFTDRIQPSYRIFDLEEHKTVAFVDRFQAAIDIARLLYKAGAFIL